MVSFNEELKDVVDRFPDLIRVVSFNEELKDYDIKTKRKYVFSIL